MIAWLDRTLRFPPLDTALREPNGLLAVGGDLTPQRLLSAYSQGIFPWFSEGDPILWWSPDPRMVLFPDELRISRSLAKTLRNKIYEVRFDTVFDAVVDACAGPRHGESGTWIVPPMREAYSRLHALGYAHSVETWIDGQLAGGLYGVAIGKMFYGESMFTRVSDGSKIALVHLVRRLTAEGYGMIDCQMETKHLASLGARPIPRSEFARRLVELIDHDSVAGAWQQSDPSPATSSASATRAASSDR
ncbi:MAG TPA: leucyl/phenylalanyl-tRNA--protein transferase [Burkholderiales bacterium]